MPSAPIQDPLVIIGSGLAGYQLATELRRLGDHRPILMLTQDGGEAYYKPFLSTALSKRQQAEALVQATAAVQAEKLQLVMRTQTLVQRIDAANRQVVTAEGESIRYDRLVLATGAAPLMPRLESPVPAGALQDANDLDSYRRLRSELNPERPVVVLGGGLIGVEMAHDLLAGGFAVTLLARSNSLLPGLVPPAVAEPLSQTLQAAGLQLQMGVAAQRIEGKPGYWTVFTDQGQALDAGVILAATGLQPRIELAQAAGLVTRRGICVNRQLQTSDPFIYALGDVAEVDGLSLMYVQPLMASAKVLAAHLQGQVDVRLVLEPMPILVKTPRCPVVAALPPQDAIGQWQFSGDPDDGVEGQLLDAGGQLLGFALSGKAVRLKAKLARLLPPLLA